MTEDEERAAKAARAKAMLKKRQQKKTATAASDATSPVASPPPSRILSPAPLDPPVEEKQRDLGDVFGVTTAKDDDWVSSLTRVPTPPPPQSATTSPPPPQPQAVSPPPPPADRTSLTSPPPPSGKEVALQKQIAALRAENEALVADAARLKELESQIQQAEAALSESRGTAKNLEERVQALQAENDTLQQNQQQTISLLVSEKASLAAELERLEGVESLAQTTEGLLEEERRVAKELDENLRRLRTDMGEATVRIQQAESKEKELAEKCREQERELQLANASIHESKKEAEKHQRRVQELREQIQSDDRLERAENSLKNTQDRADELEFQLSKLKQAHSALKTEREECETKLQTSRESEALWQMKHGTLHQEHATVQQLLETTTSEKDALSQEKAALESEISTTRTSFAQLNEKLQQVASELAASSRLLQTTQSELKASNRRAEDAEKTQKDLQTEGTTLMRSLDEMRPKIVELTGVKLELGEKIDSLEHTLRGRDVTISQLEGDLDELRDEKEQVTSRLQEVLAQHEKDRTLAQASSGELQKAYADLREELNLSNDSVRSLEAERAAHRQESSRRLEEIEQLTATSNAQLDELSMLRQELDERQKDQDEEKDFLARAQNEIESLRADLSAKDEELERLREAVSTPTEDNSLDHELLSSLRQQHALDLSNAQSQIRALENSVFDAEAKSHALRKQVSALEDQVTQLRGAAVQRALSPSLSATSRPGSRAASVRASSNAPPSLARSVLDQNLSAETRHKRKVSLSMLKARIDSEVAAHQASQTPRALSPVQSVDGDSRPMSPPVHIHVPAPFHRPQFLDDSHHVNLSFLDATMSSSTTLIESALLTGKWDTSIEQSLVSDLAKSVIEGDFGAVLKNPLAKKLFTPSSDSGLFTTAPLTENAAEDETIRLVVAVACLHAFIQINWTGPGLDFKVLDILQIDSSEESLNQRAVSELAYGGEPAYHLTQYAMLFRLAQLLLDVPSQHCTSVPWWKLRVAVVHQQILDEPAPAPPATLSALEPLAPLYANDPELSGRLQLEQGLLQHYVAQDKTAAEYFVKAAHATGLEYELTGALGKRTKFQQNETSQLVLLAESQLKVEERSVDSSSPEESQVPETLALNDDTLLEQTAFTSSSPSAHEKLSHFNPSSQPPLHPLDQSILLAMCLNVKNTSPVHGLTSEQMSPYVARVISHPLNWSVHTMALLIRARLESNRTRTVERATLQLQALIEQMPTADAPIAERLRYVHALPLPSKWEMERELATRFLSLGAVRSALDIFERLEMWEEVVKCWQSMERRDKGVTIVRDLLEGRKAEADVVLARGKAGTTEARRTKMDLAREAKLWCLLGDLEPENAREHYDRAWEVSGHTAGRAMRSLGGYHFTRNEYPEAIACLKKAVAINPLLSRSWFILGCACMRVEDWQEAKLAFMRCVSIDEEDGESWSNLASMYLRMGAEKKTDDEDSTEPAAATDAVPFENKLLAFRALKQGLRYAYENWRMWYNYMIIAIQVGELLEACRAFGRVVESRGAEAVDEDILERLVNAVTRAPNAEAAAAAAEAGGEAPAPNPNEGRGLFRSVQHLLEDVILPRTSASPRVFRAYARLLTWESRWDDALKASMDAYRCSVAGTMESGETDAKRWREAVEDVEDVVDALRNFGPRSKDEGSKWKLQARSIVRTFMGKTKDAFGDEPEWRRVEELLEELKTKRED